MNRVESAVGAHAVRGWGLGANLADAVNERKFAESRKKGAENNENGIVPLNVWAENPSALEATVWRADTVRLLPTSEQVELLLRLARATQKLVNVEHARRRALYEQSGIIDCSVKGAYHDPSYAGFKEVLGSKNFDEALCLVAESWRSFRELKEMEEQGRLPAWMKPKPPKQLKRLLVAVKYDNYRVDAQNKVIKPGYYNTEIRFQGDLRWWWQRVQQGRLVIVYDDVKGAWYAHIASEVKLKRDIRAPLKCGIDLGQERLVAAVAENGIALLYRGTVLKSEYHFLKTRVSELDKRARFADFDVEVWLEKRKWWFRRFRMRKRELGATEIYIGYPRDIKRDKPTEGNNAWPYWQTIKEIARAAENFGITAYLVPEEGTSRVCARHGCEVKRGPRGLVHWPLRPRNAQRYQRRLEHLEEGWRKSAGARQSAQLHADAGRSHRAEARKRRGTDSPASRAG